MFRALAADLHPQQVSIGVQRQPAGGEEHLDHLVGVPVPVPVQGRQVPAAQTHLIALRHTLHLKCV